MAPTNNKTVENDLSVDDFLDAVDDPKRRNDAKRINQIMIDITGHAPAMWGNSIVGYGRYHYRYDSGREGDFMKVGFSPRKQSLTLYVMPGFGRYDKLMAELGKYKTGKSCLYIRKLEDVNLEVLEQLIKESYDYMTDKYG